MAPSVYTELKLSQVVCPWFLTIMLLKQCLRVSASLDRSLGGIKSFEASDMTVTHVVCDPPSRVRAQTHRGIHRVQFELILVEQGGTDLGDPQGSGDQASMSRVSGRKRRGAIIKAGSARRKLSCPLP